MTRAMLKMAALLAVALAAPGAASAAILDLTFHGDVASVELNGGSASNEALTVDVLVDTTTLAIGTGFQGSDRYQGLEAFVTAPAFGLTQVAVTTPLWVDIGTPDEGAPFTGVTVLLRVPSIVNGLFGNTAIATWDEVSPIGPLDTLATASRPLPLSLANGDTLTIVNFENAEPFGQATFQAALAAPEPAAWALMLAGFGGLGAVLRRRRQGHGAIGAA